MSLRESFLDVVCEQRNQLPLMLAVVIVMGVLLGFSLLFLEPGTAAYVIALIDAILVVGALVVFGGAYWLCTRRAM
ncbi:MULTISPECIES: hypothetical protein [Halorubrum]|uniref:hypothetical protein n=1 Tax=Halorubrum TaxID=56688 RepID=UPI000F85ACB9|nr:MULTISPECIES: hypothetical protein [Halorubrum]AZQ15409.1 hypothetical protein DOS48_11505 [Halorubrum sp. PV6]